MDPSHSRAARVDTDWHPALWALNRAAARSRVQRATASTARRRARRDADGGRDGRGAHMAANSRSYVDAYRQRGFVVVPDVLDKDECAPIAELVEAVVRDQEALVREQQPELLTTPGRHGGGFKNVAEGRGLRSSVEVSEDLSLAWELTRPTRWYPEYPQFASLARDKRIGALANELLGGEAMIYADQAFLKPPGNGAPRSWHQDNWYFGLTNSADVLTAWIALDDADHVNGALRYKSGSHKTGVVAHTANGAERTIATEHLDPNATETVAAVRRGGVVFHHGATQHSSGTNTSDRPRRAYGVHYVRRGSRFWSDAGVTNGLPLKRLLAMPELSEKGDQLAPVIVDEIGRIQVSQGVVSLRDECSSASRSHGDHCSYASL